MGVGTSVIRPGPDGEEVDRKLEPDDRSRWILDLIRSQVSGLES